MALSVIRPNEAMQVNAIKLYIYGDPSMGKSTLGMTAEDALIIDTDKGSYRTGVLRRADVQYAETWTQVNCLTEEDLAPYKTIVIDTVGRLLDMVKAELASKKGNTKSDGALHLQAQGKANNLFQGFVNRIISYGKNVVFIAHATEDKDDDKVIHRPDLGGKNRQEIYRLSDCMAYFTNDYNDKNKLVRFLMFSRGDNYHAKDCANLRNVEVPDLASNPNFLGDLITHIKDTLNTLTPEQKAQIEWEQFWGNWIQRCNESSYASEFNALTDELVEIKDDQNHPYHPYRQNLWDAIKHCATELKMEYNKETRKWRETEVK